MWGKLKGKNIIIWTLCLFIAFYGIITNIQAANATVDPNKILTSSDIPDSIVLAKLTTLADTDGNGTITIAELFNYSGNIDLSNSNITSVQGLGYATGATVIDLSGNNTLTTIQDNAFLDCTKLTKIILPDSIISIGNSAFEGCSSLSEINLPVTLTAIGAKSFLQCTNLKSILLPTTIASVGDSAFSGSGLTSIVIPNPQMNIGISAFNGCASLTNVSLPEGMKTIPMECFKATGLTNIVIPTTVMTIEQGAFSFSNLESVDLTNCTSLTAIKTSAFSATPITSVILPESLTELGSRAFEACIFLPQINIPSKITIINELTFGNCISLVDVSFTPAAVNDYKLQEIGAQAFLGCSKLGDGNVQFLANLNNLTTIGNLAFAYSANAVKNSNGVLIKDEYNQQIYTGIQSVTLPESLVSLGDSAFEGCSALTQINIPNNVSELKAETFKNCYNLSNVTLSATLTTIGANCFESCKSLNDLTFPESLKTIGTNAFLYCANEKVRTVNALKEYVYTGLTSLSIPDSVTDIGASAFKGCFNLSSVKLPTNLTKLNDNVFYGCGIQNKTASGTAIPGSYRGIQTINIPSTLTSIGASTFYNCYNLYSDGSSLVIPYSLVSIGISAFSGSNNIGTVDFKFAGSLTTIGSSAFNGCTNLSLAGFNLAGNLNTIGASAFASSGIKGILRIPDKVTTIQSSVFQNCSGITSVELPDTLTSIGTSSFKNCTSLTSVTLPAATTFVSTGTGSSFYGCDNFSNVIVKPVPIDINVNENASVVLPIKCFSLIGLTEMGDENIATAVVNQTPPKVSINGVKTGQTTATVTGTIQYEVGKDPITGLTYIRKFETQVQFNVIVTAKKATFVSFPQTLRGIKLSSATLTLTPTIIPSDTTDLKFWSSDNPLVATVSSTGVVTPVGYGTTTIRLKVGDQPEVQCQVNVCAPAYSLSLDKTSQTLITGQSLTITPTVTYSSTYDNYKSSYPEVILWSSSDSNIATVNESGVVTAEGYGIATITAKADAGVISKTCKVTVTPQSSSITFNKTSTSILKGNTDTLTMTLNPSDLPSSLITVSSSNPTVAAVSVNQNIITIIAQKGGTAKITAQPLNGVAATCDVSVISPLTSITTTAMSLNKGATRTIAITKTPIDATDVLVYSSNNTVVATVDTTGKVTAVGAGTATINISSQSNPSISADCEVTVIVPVTGVTLSSTNAVLYNQNTLQLIATVLPKDAINKSVVWNSTNPAVATVDQSGKVTPVSPGTAMIKVTTVEGNHFATCNVTVVNINEVNIQATDAIANEAGTDPGTFTVTRTKGSTASALNVYYTVSGTATKGTDYNTLSNYVVIPAGLTTATVIIKPIDDTVVENNETAIVTLATNNSYIIGTVNNATVTIYDNDKPLAPTGLTATGVSKSQINLGWNAVSGATKYNIYRATSQTGTYSYIGSSTSNAYSSAWLGTNTIYWYKVSAVNSIGEGLQSTVVSGKTLASSTIAAPTGLIATAASKSQINLNWTAVTGATKYIVYRATSQTGTYSYLGSSNTNAFSSAWLGANTIYWYKISAVNSIGEGLQSTVVSGKTLATSTIAAPTVLTATAVSKSQINLNWTAVTGATKYIIYRATSQTGTYSYIGSSTTNAFSSAWLGANTIYWYKVSAVNTIGEGLQSTVVSGKTLASSTIAAPTGLTVTAVSKSQINLNWTAVTGATKYIVYRATSQTGTYSYLGSSTTNTFSSAWLGANTIYWYKISAVNSIGEGLQSTVVSGKTLASSTIAAPTGLIATAVSKSQINLNWTAVTGTTKYIIYRAMSQTGTYSYVGSSTTNAFSNTWLTANTTYWYKISAVNSTGEGLQSTAVSTITFMY
jgi:uncharacterized protein YjdB/fibronectin type 3 domain-containing protein